MRDIPNTFFSPEHHANQFFPRLYVHVLLVSLRLSVYTQDPSYQFKDIKQLMMGMLETYNYEEVYIILFFSSASSYALLPFWFSPYFHVHTSSIYVSFVFVRMTMSAILILLSCQTLLKTTNHILVHDVRGSLDHLCALVQQGVSPCTRQCVICSRPADSLADGSKDDVVVFRCIV